MRPALVAALCLALASCGPASNCEDRCDPGEASCTPDGQVRTCTEPDAQGCFDWSPPSPCAATQRCDDGTCRCDDECTAGNVICGPDGGRITCAGPDPQGGCFVWGDEEPCGPHQLCSAGECLCRNACTPGTTVCDGDEAVATCTGPDDDGCFFFDEPEPCPAYRHCSYAVGRCVRDTPSECFPYNQCDFEGQLLCMDETRYRSCFRTRRRCLLWDGCET